MAMFKQQLQQLSDEYERVCAVNAELRARLIQFDQKRPVPAVCGVNGEVDEFSRPLSARSLGTSEWEQGSKQIPPRMGDALADNASPPMSARSLQGSKSVPVHGFNQPTPMSLCTSSPPPITVDPPMLPGSRPQSASFKGMHNDHTLCWQEDKSENGRQSTQPTLGYDDDDEDQEPETNFVALILGDILPAIVIMLSAFVMGIEAEKVSLGISDFSLFIIELLFLIFFSVEFAVKLTLAGPTEFFTGKDWEWAWFDFVCVIVSAVQVIEQITADPTKQQETEGGGGGSIGSLMKIVKLMRLGRVIRLLKYKIFAELKSMVLGIFTGLKVFLWAVVLLLLVCYFWAIVMRMFYGDIEQLPEFKSLSSSVFTVFRCVTDGCAAYDGTPLQERLRMGWNAVTNESFTLPFPEVLFFFVWIFLYLFVTVGIFNLIIAVFIDNVNDGSAKKKQYQLGVSAAKTELRLAEAFREQCIDTGLAHQRKTLRQRMTNAVVAKLEDLESAASGKPPRRNRDMEKLTAAIKKEMLGKEVSVNKEVFNAWIRKGQSHVLDALDDAEIDISMKYELFEILDTEIRGQLTFTELLEGLMKCRGPISKVDMVSVRLQVKFLTSMVKDIHGYLMRQAEMTTTKTMT
eukprot:TRINITY_DN7248_c0_g1_i1.p1 TRINITY_DN7248_c0_g1~~TRINITY_DN7248_c0_g1_i1.p1  ORF type:complete len:630 (-),score=102.35 TRINITY_DN7248_c0_g1_i1:313-2202(-)